jgi:hypothetical protein
MECPEDVGLVGRPALGQDVDQLEIGERPDDREQGGDQDHAFNRWHRDVPKPVPGICPVDGRRLVQLAGHGLEPGQDGDSEEGRTAPDIGQTNGCNGKLGIAQKIDILVNNAGIIKDNLLLNTYSSLSVTIVL